MTTCKVAHCGRPVDDAWVCMHCAGTLERALGDIPAIVHQLDITLAKGGRFADRNERAGAETPLPIDPRALKARSQLRAHLVAWVRLISEERGMPLPGCNPLAISAWLQPAESPEAMSAWMLHHVEWLRHHQAGHDAIDELVADVDYARKVIDVPANRTTFPVGPCPELASEPVSDPTLPGLSGQYLARCTGHCPGEVRAYIPNDETKPCRLECTVCHTTWGTVQWRRAGHRIKERQAEMEGAA